MLGLYRRRKRPFALVQSVPSMNIAKRARRLPGPAATTLMGTGIELLVGAGFMALAALAGLVFVQRPLPNRLDTFWMQILPANYTAGWAHELTHFGSLPALIIGMAILLAVGLSRDWVRGIGCAVAPIVAVLIVQEVAKPLIEGHVKSYGDPSYPSGTVTVVTALATAAVLVTPRVLRGVTACIGLLAVLATCSAVVVLRWHYPTAAIGGVCVGAGAVLLVDALLHLPPALRSPAVPAAGPDPNDWTRTAFEDCPATSDASPVSRCDRSVGQGGSEQVFSSASEAIALRVSRVRL